MTEIALRGELWDNDSADVLRFFGWRDITCPEDVRAGLEKAGGSDVTLLINSPGGDMTVGLEIRSMLRRYAGRTTALYQGYGASAATLAASGCQRIESEPGALLCYHNPVAWAEGDFRDMAHMAEGLQNARDCILEVYTARENAKSREELMELMDKNIWITPTQACEYGLIDGIVSGGLAAGPQQGPGPGEAGTAAGAAARAAGFTPASEYLMNGDPGANQRSVCGGEQVPAAGGAMPCRITDAMRQQYRQHIADEKRRKSEKILARARALNEY